MTTSKLWTTDDFRDSLPRLVPHLIAVLVMFFAAGWTLSPAMFDGKRLRQGDIQNNIGMSKEARDLERVEGDVPQWTDAMFGGMPTIQITGPGVDTAPKSVWQTFRALMPMEVATLFVAMISAYVLGLCLGLSPWISLALGIGFGLSSVNILYLAAGHATKVRAIATMPGVVAGTVLAFRGKPWRGAGVAALFAALHLDANHVQMTYYLLFLLGAIALGAVVVGAVQSKLPQTMKAVGLLVVAGFVAALPQTSQLALTEQYAQYTTRGEAVLAVPSEEGGGQGGTGLDREYILEYSMSRGEFWSMVVPDVKGGNNQLYWGEQRFSGGAFYFGALAFALCLAWLIAGSHWLRWPLLAVSMLAIVLSWRDATWLTDVFLERVPLFNKFRDTKMMLVLLQMVVPVGAAMALHEVQSDQASKQWKRWAGAGAASAVLMALFYVLPDTFFDFKSSLRPDMAMEQLGNRVKGMRVDVFRADVLRALGLSLLGLGVIVTLVKRWVDARWVVIGTVVVVTLDMGSVNNRYLGPNNYETVLDKRFPFEATPADRAILAAEQGSVSDFEGKYRAAQARWEDKLDAKLTRRYARAQDAAAFEVLNANTHHRVFDLANPFNDARTSYFHKSVGGYHGAKLRRYQDFIERVLTPERAAIIAQIQAGQFQLGADVAPGLAMLNTKYMLVPGAEQPLPFVGGLGPAWFVDKVTWVGSAEEEISGIAGLNPSAQALVHTEFEATLGQVNAPGSNDVTLEKYHPEGSTYSVNSERGGLLVLSEVHYPVGWTATVDGEEVPLVRVNYILSGLEVPAGEHQVQLTFEPEGWGTAKMLSRAGSLLLAALLGLSIRFGSRESEG